VPGSVIQGQTGATFSVTVGDAAGAGPVPAGGPVTLAISMPPGTILTGLSGPDWTCPPSNPNGILAPVCTNPVSLPPGQSYPALTGTFNVQAGATIGRASFGFEATFLDGQVTIERTLSITSPP
jgi:hypothetical protein